MKTVTIDSTKLNSTRLIDYIEHFVRTGSEVNFHAIARLIWDHDFPDVGRSEIEIEPLSREHGLLHFTCKGNWFEINPNTLEFVLIGKV